MIFQKEKVSSQKNTTIPAQNITENPSTHKISDTNFESSVFVTKVVDITGTAGVR